ncbi:hypothetical protein [Caproicibacter fermentans]|uniref:Uncharacterized protein n=1 Tax=Caproicibacter fermentans TaxID=2576756 RepID=A0A7G8TD73_9FIRM|nr:hypothetical protein [Caproicibacter fermentans]QNK41564.1 hypothetical protein HCR03_04685 [Caproicibacter fermentans]
MRITGYKVSIGDQHIGSTPIEEQAIDAAKAYAVEKGATVSVIAFIDDGRTREINVHPDGTLDRLWEKSSTTIVPGCTYTNHNGGDYLCQSIPDDNSAVMERVKDKWTLVAHGIEKYEDGTIEWDYSTGGHWKKEPMMSQENTRAEEIEEEQEDESQQLTL